MILMVTTYRFSAFRLNLKARTQYKDKGWYIRCVWFSSLFNLTEISLPLVLSSCCFVVSYHRFANNNPLNFLILLASLGNMGWNDWSSARSRQYNSENTTRVRENTVADYNGHSKECMLLYNGQSKKEQTYIASYLSDLINDSYYRKPKVAEDRMYRRNQIDIDVGFLLILVLLSLVPGGTWYPWFVSRGAGG